MSYQLDRPCVREHVDCQHPFDDHILMPTAVDPQDGGIVLCPHRGCECLTTWAVEDREVARIPSEGEIATLRRELQEVLGR